jgi:hypothetical protein
LAIVLADRSVGEGEWRNGSIRTWGQACNLSIWLDRGFIDKHDRNIILYGINPVALCAFQTFRILSVIKFLFARRTNQNFQEIFGNHDFRILRYFPNLTTDTEIS